jgi:hypothetical protein
MSRVWEVVTTTDIFKMVLIGLLGWACLASVFCGVLIFIGGDLSINGKPWSELELDLNLVFKIVAGAIFTVLFSTLSFLFGRMVLRFLMAIMPEKKNAKT